MIKIYSDKNWLPPNINHTVLLYPFWGEIPVPIGEPDGDRFKHYVSNSSNIIQLLTNPDESDFFVLPFEYRKDNDLIELANSIASQASKVNKKLLVFFNSDSTEEILINNAIIFRTSFFKSTKKINEFAFPGWSVDFQTAYSKGFLAIEKDTKPKICYCGYAANKNRGLKQKINDILRKPSYTSQTFGAYIREKALKYLKSNKHINCDFIIRDEFWAAQSKGLSETRLDYAINMLNSPYALVARGAGNFSYRIYEVLSCGRIPVFINTDCVLPYDEFVNWKEHMVWVEHDEVSKIGTILSNFHNNISSEEFKQLQLKNRKLYEEWVSPYGFFSKLNLLKR
jgi:hypothetical protein